MDLSPLRLPFRHLSRHSVIGYQPLEDWVSRFRSAILLDPEKKVKAFLSARWPLLDFRHLSPYLARPAVDMAMVIADLDLIIAHCRYQMKVVCASNLAESNIALCQIFEFSWNDSDQLAGFDFRRHGVTMRPNGYLTTFLKLL